VRGEEEGVEKKVFNCKRENNKKKNDEREKTKIP
jgi:hypothetical protein